MRARITDPAFQPLVKRDWVYRTYPASCTDPLRCNYNITAEGERIARQQRGNNQ
jgi:hypothetical protein